MLDQGTYGCSYDGYHYTVQVNLFGMGGLSNPKEYILSTRKFTYNECALLVVVLFE